MAGVRRCGPRPEGVLRENIERILNLHAYFVNPKHHVRDGGGDDHELGERGAPRGDHSDQASRHGRQHDQPQMKSPRSARARAWLMELLASGGAGGG